MAEEEKEGEVDGEDSGALAGGGGGQKRTQGQKSEARGCAAGSQKTDCGGHKLPRSKPHKGDQRSETDHGIKGARKGSDMEMGGVQGSKVVHGFRGGLSEVRSSRARWTRDSPGSFALSHHHFLAPQLIPHSCHQELDSYL